MRREEFYDAMNNMDDLYQFACDHDLDAYYNVIPSNDLDEKVCDDIREATRHWDWVRIRDALDDIDSGCDYYTEGDGWLEFNELCFEDYYEMIVEEMDNGELWDDGDSDEEYDEEDEEEEEDDLPTECFFAFDGFVDSVKDEAASIRERLEAEEKAQREEEQRRLEEAQRLIDEAKERAKREEEEREAMLKGLLSIPA